MLKGLARKSMQKYNAIVIGTSAGGKDALTKLLTALPENFSIPVIIVLHLHPGQTGYHIECLNNRCALTVKEANEKESIEPGNIYFAPPDYHLLIEENKTFSLSVDKKVNYSRPSINVLFESAADVFSSALTGIVLTGANNDGADGMCSIKEAGGMTICQEPSDAEYPFMPQAAIDAVKMDYILPLGRIADLLKTLLKG